MIDTLKRGSRLALAVLALLLPAAATAQEGGTPAAPPTTAASPAPALPAGVQQVRFGAAVRDRTLTGVARCAIPEPLPSPYRFEPGTTEMAYTIEVDPQAVKGVTAKVLGDLGCAEPWSQGCPGYTVCGGGVCQSQYGATLKCPDGKPLRKGSYKLSLTVGGKTVELPFEIQ